MVAAGPFTTSDNLDMEPLHDLLGVVRRERPSVLVLVSSRLSHSLLLPPSPLPPLLPPSFLLSSCLFLCFVLQFGPFVDSTHESIKVSVCDLIFHC